MVDIIQTLLEMRNGKVASEINRKFAELMNAIYTHRKPGAITISIKVSPDKFDEAMQVSEVKFAPDVKLAKPERPLETSMFFVTDGGNLSRTDPAQRQMFEQQEEEELKRNG